VRRQLPRGQNCFVASKQERKPLPGLAPVARLFSRLFPLQSFGQFEVLRPLVGQAKPLGVRQSSAALYPR
jgi:hypothetical protein